MTTRKLRLGPLPKTESTKLTFACPASLKADLDRYATLHAQTGRCHGANSAHARSLHGRRSGIQEGRRGQGRAAEAKLMMPVSAGGHPSNAQPKAARSSFWRTATDWAMKTKRGYRLQATAPDAARSGFLPRSSYVAPSPQRHSPARRPEVEPNPHPI